MLVTKTLVLVFALGSAVYASPLTPEDEKFLFSHTGNETFADKTVVGKLRNVIDLGNVKSRKKRTASLLRMVNCASRGCGRLYLLWYGSYCGLLGSGIPINSIDECCRQHDRCYDNAGRYCGWWTRYFGWYDWSCSSSGPYCYTYEDTCHYFICKCDRDFVNCLNREALNYSDCY